jgi:predicted ATPase
MAIRSVTLGNFKGIGNTRSLELRPITIFIGANSSGKSSCIHALAALSQTVKVTNDRRPLVLDDEFAMVHLGRFIEIVHSKSYQDFIELGIGLDTRELLLVSENKEKKTFEPKRRKGEISANYRFKCTKRTQEVNLESAHLQFGSDSIQVRRGADGRYFKQNPGNPADRSSPLTLESAFFFEATGFLPKQFETMYSVMGIQKAIKEELAKTLYLGPFRQGPLRRYPTRGAGPNEVGALGESTITMLANETIQSGTRTHIKQVAGWLKDLGLAKTVEVARVGASDLFDVSMMLDDGKSFPLADLGYGMSQVLPVLAQCSFAPKGATLLFEQPEIHLHVVAARKLAAVFADTATNKKATIVIETHAPELVKSFIQLLKVGGLKREEVVIYRVTRRNEQSEIESLEFDEHFDVYEDWEKGIAK